MLKIGMKYGAGIGLSHKNTDNYSFMFLLRLAGGDHRGIHRGIHRAMGAEEVSRVFSTT